MKIVISIDTDAIKALELFAGKHDARSYLNGIHVEALSPDTVRLVATDGHRAIVYRPANAGPFQATSPEETCPVGGVIPRDIFKGLPRRVDWPTLQVDTVRHRWEINDGERSGALLACHSDFPDIDRVWPSNVSFEMGHYNEQYIADIGKAAALLGHKSGATLIQNGTRAAVFAIGEEWAGLLMPMRREPCLPTWVPTKMGENREQQAA